MIFIALGSSIEPKTEYFEKAEALLQACGVQIIKKSKNYETPPEGGVAKNTFLNAVWQIETSFTPFGLLKLLQRIETKCKRTRTQKWEDRTLDLDIIAFRGKKINTKTLQIPHPLANQRDFVLNPLKDVIGEKEIEKILAI